MSETNAMKRKLFILQKLLYEKTDEDHPLTTPEILNYLEEQGCPINQKTLKRDIDLMNDCGMDIVKIAGKPDKIFWGKRTFDLAELRLLIDAVSSSRFITQRKSEELTDEIISLSSEPEKEKLKRNIYATNRVKSYNTSLLYIVNDINDAINNKKRIRFQYSDYSPEKKRILKNDGEKYVLSPYALFWNVDYYYVIGYSDKHKNISSFRVDRINNIEILSELARAMPRGFSLEKYSKQIFEMFDGESVHVKLECKNYLMKYVIDRFGESVKTEIATEESFYAYPEVSLSPNFYSWLFKFAGDMSLISPAHAKEEYLRKAQLVLEDSNK